MASCPVRHRIRALACALVLPLAVAAVASGCGMDVEESRSLSKREYIEASNDLQADAASVFGSLDGRVAATPAQAERYLTALDQLAEGLDELDPPREWRDEHATMVESVRTMRQAMSIVSRASPRNAKVIGVQLERSSQAQRDYEQAVRDINASR